MLQKFILARDMQKIRLSGGEHVLVDNEDYALGIGNKWMALKLRTKNYKQVYAIRTHNSKRSYLHREIMKQVLLQQNKSPTLLKNRRVYFKNSNTLDCRRDNLFLAPKDVKLRQRH